jgi:thioesterase domain-containing protein
MAGPHRARSSAGLAPDAKQKKTSDSEIMKNVKDIYSLSPMQEVMLLHAMSRRSDDVLFNQFCYEIRGPLDKSAFEQAWCRLVQRHEILRTAFLWEDLKTPIQVVRQRVDVPFEFSDWSKESQSAQARLLDEYCESDRQQGFDPRKAPLMRFALMDRGENAHYFVWSSHHLLLDRWCLRRLFEEFFEFYQAAREGIEPRLDEVAQFSQYINWIKLQDKARTREYWQSVLGGLSAAVPVTRTVADQSGEQSTLELRADKLDAIRRLARAAGVTLPVLMQAGWSVLLHELTGRQDVLFGTVVAGRPPELPGVESIIGSFVNNVPVRVRLPRDISLNDWLRSLQEAQYERSAFEYASPTSIQRWSDFPLHEPMFDTLIVALAATGVPVHEDVQFLPLPGKVVTAYPLTLTIDETDSGLKLEARLQSGRQCVRSLDELLSSLSGILGNLAQTPLHEPVEALQSFSGTLTSAELFQSRSLPTSASPEESSSIAYQTGREEGDIRIMMDLLRTEWESALGTKDFGPDDDFFRLGGSSLQAAGLHARLEEATRKSLPMLALFRSTSLRGMAETLARGNWPLRTDLAIGLRRGGSRPPLFCVASPEVNTIGYALLARYLDDEQPVYVLQAPPSDGAMRRISPTELPELARVYLREMRRVQQDGPYHLLGMCTGSQLVLEMARQLDAAGETIPFAGIINTWALYTVSQRYRIQKLLNNLDWYVGRLRDLSRLSPAGQLAAIREIWGRRTEKLLARTGTRAVGRTGLSGVNSSGRELIEKSDVEGANDEQPDHADPWIDEFGWQYLDPGKEKYSGPLTVFRQKPQPFWRTGDEDLGWGRHVEDVETVYLPGTDHHAILREPAVQSIARHVADQLEIVRKKENQ